MNDKNSNNDGGASAGVSGYVAVASLSGERFFMYRDDFAAWIAGPYDAERKKNGLQPIGHHAALLMFDAVAEYERRIVTKEQAT